MSIFHKLFKSISEPSTPKPATQQANNSIKKQEEIVYIQHYLKDLSHRPVSKPYYTKTEAFQLAPQYLKIAEECTKIVNSTNDHRTFFTRYDMLICYLVELQKMKYFVKFTGKDVSVFLNEVLSTREEQIRLLIHRIYEMAKRNMDCSQHQKVKLQQYTLYNKAIQDIECELSEKSRAEAEKLRIELEIICNETKDQMIKRWNKQAIEMNLEVAKDLETDLVEASYHRGCCGECAKYRGRWFSISGKDKRFPKMPVDYGCACSGIDFSPVIYGTSEPAYCPENMDIISYSNRPFIDDRDEEETEIYELDGKRIENEKFFEPYKKRWNAISEYDHKQYALLCKLLPDIAPKSYSGYMRMKKNTTKNYLKIKQEALSHGIELDYTDELKTEIEFLTPIRDKYLNTLAEINKFHEKYKK